MRYTTPSTEEDILKNNSIGVIYGCIPQRSRNYAEKGQISEN